MNILQISLFVLVFGITWIVVLMIYRRNGERCVVCLFGQQRSVIRIFVVNIGFFVVFFFLGRSQYFLIFFVLCLRFFVIFVVLWYQQLQKCVQMIECFRDVGEVLEFFCCQVVARLGWFYLLVVCFWVFEEFSDFFSFLNFG